MKNKTYSRSIADVINNFLTEDDWHYTFDDKIGVFRFDLDLDGRIKNISYYIEVTDDEYVVYAVSPIGADSNNGKMMASMADFICRANYGLINGNFELDMRDGEIRYKTFLDCKGITPSAEMVRNSIRYPAAMFERYGAGIIDVINGDAAAEEAIESSEGSLLENLCSFLSEKSDKKGGTDLLITRLAARFGIYDD